MPATLIRLLHKPLLHNGQGRYGISGLVLTRAWQLWDPLLLERRCAGGPVTQEGPQAAKLMMFP